MTDQEKDEQIKHERLLSRNLGIAFLIVGIIHLIKGG
jgi:hypothetical protein